MAYGPASTREKSATLTPESSCFVASMGTIFEVRVGEDNRCCSVFIRYVGRQEAGAGGVEHGQDAGVDGDVRAFSCSWEMMMLSRTMEGVTVGVLDWVEANAGVLVAVSALLFTTGSWWWLHARKGRLKVAEVHNFSGYVNADVLSVRLPLLFENTGARPRVIHYLRLRLRTVENQRVYAEALAFFPTLEARDKDAPGGRSEYFHAFAVPAFGVETKYVSFRAVTPPITPGRSVSVSLEELISPGNWRVVRTFELHTEVLTSSYVTVSNLEAIWPAGFADGALEYQRTVFSSREESQ